MDMKINTQLLKKLRKEKAWSQEELAVTSNLSLRTIQRIEKDGNASLESKKAIASAFEIKVSDLDFNENASAITDDADENFFFRITDGSKLSEIINGAHAYRMSHDVPETEDEVELLAWVAQAIQDWGDIWSELEAGARIKATYDLSQLIKELESKDYWIFGNQTSEEYPGIVGENWTIAKVYLVHLDNPKIMEFDLTENS